MDPTGSNYVWSLPVPNKNEANSALTYYLNLSKVTDTRRQVLTSLIAHILSEPAFAVLRTREQLGYIVNAAQWRLPGGGQSGVVIVVQSERDPLYVEQRVNAFLREMLEKIENMEDADFQEHKSALQKQWREAPKNLHEEVLRYSNQVEQGYLNFHRGELFLSSAF